MPEYGIDVSNNNGSVDWRKVATSGRGISFAYLKASEGDSFADRFYKGWRKQAQANGIAVGAYHFARPHGSTADAAAQARRFLQVAAVQPRDLRPALDLEVRDSMSPAGLRVWALAFLVEVERQLGTVPLLYTYPAFAAENGFSGAAALRRYPLWIANYGVKQPTIPAPWKSAAVWQYSANGAVPGVGGKCDLNRLLLSPDPLAPLRQ